MIRKGGITVTDHAVLRYLERQHNVPVEAIRAAIARACDSEPGATYVVIRNVRVVVENRTAVTVLAEGMRPMSQAQAERRRKKRRRGNGGGP